MARPELPIDNAGIREVRRWRERLQRQGGGTLDGLWNLLQANGANPARAHGTLAKPKAPTRSTKPAAEKSSRSRRAAA